MDSPWLIGYLCLVAAALVQAVLVAMNVYEHRRRALVRLKKLSCYAPSGRVHVFSPCKGLDADLQDNLRALLTQDYPDYEVTFIVEDSADAACPAIRQAMAACPKTPSRLLVAGRAEACGQKVHNLRAATADLPPDVRHLAFFDSDSRPKPFWVRAAIYKHYRPEIGATTGYRWLIPQRPTVPNHLVCAINCNVMAVLGRDARHWVWGGSWAIRRETFEQLGIHEAWSGTLSDDLVASNRLRTSGLQVRFDPACVLTSPVDFDWSGMFDFVRRQYSHHPALCFPLVVAGPDRGDGRQPGLDGLLGAACVEHFREPSTTWLPAAGLTAIYALGLYRGWAMQGLASVYSPESAAQLRGARRWHIWASPIVAFVQWLGLIASAFGKRVRWRSIEYELGANGRVVSQRILARLKNDQ